VSVTSLSSSFLPPVEAMELHEHEVSFVLGFLSLYFYSTYIYSFFLSHMMRGLWGCVVVVVSFHSSSSILHWKLVEFFYILFVFILFSSLSSSCFLYDKAISSSNILPLPKWADGNLCVVSVSFLWSERELGGWLSFRNCLQKILTWEYDEKNSSWLGWRQTSDMKEWEQRRT
jgi:hypothetical protein